MSKIDSAMEEHYYFRNEYERARILDLKWKDINEEFLKELKEKYGKEKEEKEKEEADKAGLGLTIFMFIILAGVIFLGCFFNFLLK